MSFRVFVLLVSLFFTYCGFAEQSNITLTPPNKKLPSHKVSATQKRVLSFKHLMKGRSGLLLTGTYPKLDLEFQIRKDQLVTDGNLLIHYTPSPSLLANQSHIKVEFNDNLLGIIDIKETDLGKKSTARMPIDPLFVKDFNRVSIDFVGQYKAPCPGRNSPALWLDIGQNSVLNLVLQQLPLANDLSVLPIPFFDPLDAQRLNLNLSLPNYKNAKQQLAASILGSWFGTLSQWRGVEVNLLNNQLSKENTIVLLTNKSKPEGLSSYPEVTKPTLEVMNNPVNPAKKLLVISGRDEEDLIVAVKALAQAPEILTGQKVVIKDIKPLAPRKPYDAPSWINVNQPVSFASLMAYSEQLQTKGITPPFVAINFKTPPDLYLNHTQGIALDLIYRYSQPTVPQSSRLMISFNNTFIKSYPLETDTKAIGLLPNVIGSRTGIQTEKKLRIPAQKLGSNNQLQFDFQYAVRVVGGNQQGQCVSTSIEPNEAIIDGQSLIDFSSYRHYIRMPNLKAFMFGGFPFSKMADLSDTLVYISKEASKNQVNLLLNLMARMGAETGLPTFRLTITHNWESLKSQNKDIVVIGNIPNLALQDKQLSVYISKKETWLRKPSQKQQDSDTPINEETAIQGSQARVSSDGALGAITQTQSPYFKNRTLVAFLANNAVAYSLLNNMLLDDGLRAKIEGSVSLVRTSGVTSLNMGDVYYLGHIPFYTKLWFLMLNYPYTLAFSALIGVFLATWLLKRLLNTITHRRLNPMQSSNWED